MKHVEKGRPGWAMGLILALASSATVACGGEGDSAAAGAPAAADTPPPPPPAEAAPEEPESDDIVRELHLAFFGEDQDLENCADVTITVTRENEPDGGVDGIVDRFIEASNRATRITRPCSDQFSGRTQWASCTGTRTASGRTMHMVERYYDFGRAFDTDQFMRECLENGGDWNAVSRESDEWRRASDRHRLDSLADEARRSQDELRRRVGR